MLDKILENMAKGSSYFGDFLMNPKATTVRLFHDVTVGSIPYCPECNKKAMECFCKHIDALVEKGVDNDS